MVGGSRQPQQQSGSAGGSKAKAEIKVEPGKPALLPFKKALLYARSLKLKNRAAWRVLCKSDARLGNMPARPEAVYKHDGWQGYGHWLGTGNEVGGKRQEFLPFKKALLHARSLKLKTVKGWEAWSRSSSRPANIPSTPHTVYTHDGWQGYGHWLGTGAVARQGKQFLPFKEALLHARTLNLKGSTEWREWSKTSARPANIPSNPETIYKHDGWQGYGQWLGTGNVASKDLQFLPFEKALLYARSLKLTSEKEWRKMCKTGARPANMPSNPHATYKHDGWQGYGHWLGTGAVANKNQQFLPFEKALLYARSLKLEGVNEWEAWRKSSLRPANIPSRPDRTYTHDGWQGMKHWLGTL